jgi:clan AA aspartic protease
MSLGAIYVNAVIRNPADSEREWEGLFLVDTGATDCLVPRKYLETIGLVPKTQRTYVLADGSEYQADVTVAEVEFMGEIVGATVIIADADTEPLLGVTALESAGIEVDPRNETLRRLPAVRLKGLKRNC